MQGSAGGRWLSGLLFVACVLAAAWLAWRVYQPLVVEVSAGTAQEAVLAPEKALDLTVLDAPPFVAQADVVERTLFRIERSPQLDDEPPQQAVEEVPEPPTEPPPYRLLGVIKTKEKQVALLAPIRGGDVLRVPVGVNLEEWTVASIAANSVILTSAGREETLKIDRTPKPRKVAKSRGKEKGKRGKREGRGNSNLSTAAKQTRARRQLLNQRAAAKVEAAARARRPAGPGAVVPSRRDEQPDD